MRDKRGIIKAVFTVSVTFLALTIAMIIYLAKESNILSGFSLTAFLLFLVIEFSFFTLVLDDESKKFKWFYKITLFIFFITLLIAFISSFSSISVKGEGIFPFHDFIKSLVNIVLGKIITGILLILSFLVPIFLFFVVPEDKLTVGSVLYVLVILVIIFLKSSQLTDNQNTSSLLIDPQWVGAIGTWFSGTAVIYLIYSDFVKNPNLIIKFEQKENYCKRVPYGGPKKIFIWNENSKSYEHKEIREVSNPECYFIRVLVENQTSFFGLRKIVARKCIGKLVEIKSSIPSEEVKSIDSVQLSWSSRGPFAFDTMDIAVKEQTYLDIAYTVKESNAIYLPIPPFPIGMWDTLYEKCKYFLKIGVYGENFNPIFIFLTIDWNGKWDEIKIQKITEHEFNSI